MVAYGGLGGAERLWWLLRHFGHEACAVIDLGAWHGPLARGEESELYDYTTRAGYQEIENRAGRSPLEEHLRASLEEATREELHAPLPFRLLEAQQRGLVGYQELAVQARKGSELHRLRAVERLVHQI